MNYNVCFDSSGQRLIVKTIKMSDLPWSPIFSELSVAVCGYEFHIGTLRGNFRHYKFWPYLNFLLEQQIELVLTVFLLLRFIPITLMQLL